MFSGESDHTYKHTHVISYGTTDFNPSCELGRTTFASIAALDPLGLGSAPGPGGGVRVLV